MVAPSASAEIVRVATRIGSTPSSPSEARAMAFTILLTSTGSSAPLRFLTRMPPAVGCAPDGAAGAFAVSVSVGAAPVRCADSAAASVVAALSSITVTVGSPARSLRRRRVVGIVWNRSRNCCRPPDVVVIPRRWHHMSWQRVRNYSSETTGVSTVSSRNGQLACTAA